MNTYKFSIIACLKWTTIYELINKVFLNKLASL